jgi:hypothetical protein
MTSGGLEEGDGGGRKVGREAGWRIEHNLKKRMKRALTVLIRRREPCKSLKEGVERGGIERTFWSVIGHFTSPHCACSLPTRDSSGRK